MRQIVIDAGPLIGLLYAKDRDREQCRRGFAELASSKTAIVTPLPIVYEVYKWLLQRASPDSAQNALQIMQESMHVVPLDRADFERVCELARSLHRWQGSLEDATVAVLGLRYRCPVWTLNFRDFGAIKTLQFWMPT
ncbi:MAG: PIN domain-containing protein [Cyanobacteria bacterium J06641_5]